MCVVYTSIFSFRSEIRNCCEYPVLDIPLSRKKKYPQWASSSFRLLVSPVVPGNPAPVPLEKLFSDSISRL